MYNLNPHLNDQLTADIEKITNLVIGIRNKGLKQIESVSAYSDSKFRVVENKVLDRLFKLKYF